MNEEKKLVWGAWTLFYKDRVEQPNEARLEVERKRRNVRMRERAMTSQRGCLRNTPPFYRFSAQSRSQRSSDSPESQPPPLDLAR